MKANGKLEDWEVRDRGPGNPQIIGRIFGFESDWIKDGDKFNFFTVTEPPFFKSRIVTSTSGKFYLLGEPLNKEDNLT